MSDKQLIGIIYGGKSSEHEVSLRTAFSILEAVDYNRFACLPIYIRLDGTWVQGNIHTKPVHRIQDLRLDHGGDVSIFALARQVDVMFPVVHGPFGEDGTLQGLLEMIDVPYVGSGVLGSALGMDKLMMKKVFAMHDIPQGDYFGFMRKDIHDRLSEVCSQIEEKLTYPCFVKPANMGSSVGISKAKDRQGLVDSLQLAARYDVKVIVEQFIDGREVEIGVLGNEQPQTSVTGEIFTVGEFYDYAAKYKNIGTELQIPADIPVRITEQISHLAKRAFTALECSGLARVDFFYDEKRDQVFLNEINTMPGFTPFSMYPMLFEESGISYTTLVKRLIQYALERHEEKKANQVMAESLEE